MELAQNRRVFSMSSFRAFAVDIKIAHSIFALPFAAAVIWLAELAVPTLLQAFLLVCCMVSARSFAMGMNRYLDRSIDMANPRTRNRKIPSGELSEKSSIGWIALFATVFVGAASMLSSTAGLLSVPLLAVLAFYSKWKKISFLCHWYLGLCLGLAPVAVIIALGASVNTEVVLLAAAITMWTAGFDILYSMQDFRFDRDVGLKSIPARFGPRIAIYVSRTCFLAMITLLSVVGAMADLSNIYFLGVGAIGLVLGYEQYIIRDAIADGHSDNMNAAFFNANAAVSILFLFFVILDRVVM